MTDTGGSWRISLACAQADAERIAASDPVDGLPVLLAREIDPARPDEWVLETYLADEPDEESLTLFRDLVPNSDASATIDWIAPADWLTLSQSGLEPVCAGRFFVHTAAYQGQPPEDAVVFRIEASRAFGTGHHETTTGCLATLDHLKRQGVRFSNVADIGTGTGLLAFAALRLWPWASVIASDIDPIAIEVAHENAAINGVAIGGSHGAVELVTAAGMGHRRLRRRAPYDLIIANILAGPLIDLAPVLANALDPGGTIILAGLLDHQAEKVADAYRRHGMQLNGAHQLGEWPTLRMTRRRSGVRMRLPPVRQG